MGVIEDLEYLAEEYEPGDYVDISAQNYFQDALDEIKRLRRPLLEMLRVKETADGKNPLLSNQGQALDGYSELANYRSILEKLCVDQ